MNRSEEETYNRPDLLQEMVFSEDFYLFKEHMDILCSGQISSIEYRIILESNELKWVQSIGIPVLDRDNQVYRIDGVILDITEKKAAQERLENTLSLYQEILDTIDVAIWSFDIASKKVSFISDAIAKITGYSVKEARGIHLWSDIAHPDDRHIVDHIIASARQGVPAVCEYRIIDAHGELKWVQVRLIPSLNRCQAVVRLDGIVSDITSRKVMEEELHRNEQRYKSLFEYNSDVVCELDLQGNILAINRIAEKITGERLNVSEDSLSIMNIFGSEYAGLMTDYLEKAIAGDSSHYTVTSCHKDGGMVHWDMKNIPIQVNNQVVGAFAIAKDVTLRREAEQRLAKCEAEYRLITDNMKDLMVVLDSSGELIMASPSCVDIMEMPIEQIISDNMILEHIHPEDRQNVIDRVLTMFHTRGSELLRFRFVQDDGYVIHLETICTPVFGDIGEMKNIVIVSRDITQRVGIENELRESEERYRRLIELSPQPMVLIRDSKVSYMNPAGLDMLGANHADDIQGDWMYDYIHSDYWVEGTNRMLQLMDKKYLGSTEYKIIRVDGQIIETEVIGIYDEITKTIIIIIKDITERLKMERAIQESEERYRRLVELSPVAIAVYKDGKINYINPAGAKMLGVEPKGDKHVTYMLLDWIHPEYRKYVQEAMDHTLLNGYSLPAEYRVVHSDGHVIIVSMLSIYDSHSSSIQLMFEDITEKKQVEQALLESVELNSLLIRMSPEAIVVHSDYKFIYVNHAGLELFGVSNAQELIGKSILGWAHPDYWWLIKERMDEIYRQQMICSTPVEQKVIRSDGEIIDVEVTANSIPYKEGFAAISIFHNISNRKRVEEERRRTEQVIRVSEERYFRLQTSLDRFSHDLFGVMKISQMEQRLLKEVRDLLQISNVSIIQVDQNHDKLCEIIETEKGYLLKIGNAKARSYLLCIDEKPSILNITSIRVWLKTITRYVSVLFDHFLLIEDLTKELEQATLGQVSPTWFLRFMFHLSENERKRLSQDLHDSALQEQIIWYRKLDLLLADPLITGTLREQLGQITDGLLDVIYQLRITCNELRPPMLISDGLTSSLEALFDFTQLRADYSIQFEVEHLTHTLQDDILIGLYRIVQELLANASKHSSATRVRIALSDEGEGVRMEYQDNGIGMDVAVTKDSLKSMGIYSMKERIRSMDGTIQFRSSENNGLAVYISLPGH